MAENNKQRDTPNSIVSNIIIIITVLVIIVAIGLGIYLLKPARYTLLLYLLIGAITFGLLGVYPLTYFAYLAYGADAQRKRLRDDFRLFGLVDDKDLDETINTLYHNVYSPPQFVIYIILIVVVTVILATAYVFRDQQGIIEPGIIEIMLFAYLGGYIFSIQELIRRYNTFDLQPQVYSSILVRMLVAIALVFVIVSITGVDDSLLQPEGTTAEGNSQAWMIIIAFAIGIFPSDGLRWILRHARRILNPPIEQGEGLPLKNILGISTWHESRLSMMGIDNAQNLATVDIPKLLLTTQFDTQQVANWIDQAILYVKVGDHIDRFREAKINTFHEFQRTMDSFIDDNPADHPNNNTVDNTSRLSSLATVLGLANTYELNRLREFSNFPNYTHLDNFYEGSGRIGSLRAEESVQKLMGIPVIGWDWSSDVSSSKENKEALTDQETRLKMKLLGRKKDPILFKELGNVYLKQETPESCQNALKQFDRAIEIDDRCTEAYIGRSNVNLKLDNLNLAIMDISRVIELEPSNAQAYNRRGEIYLKSGFYDRAIEDINHALKLDPSLAVAYNNRGVVYNAQGMYGEAIVQYEYAIIAGLEEHLLPGLWYVWGLALILLDNYQEAIEKFSIAITKNHKLSDAFLNRGKAYIESGEAYYDQAKKDLDMALAILKENEEEDKGWALDNDLGMLEFKKGNFKNSIPHFRTAVEKHKKLTGEAYFWGIFNLAMAYRNLDDLDLANEQFMALRQLAKDRLLNATERERYEYLAERLGYSELIILEKVLQTNRQFGDSNGEARALVHLASFFKRRSNRDEAVNHLNRASNIYSSLDAQNEIVDIQNQLKGLNTENN